MRSSSAGNAGTCRQLTTPSSQRDTQWATHTCPLTFQSVGVWPEQADGTDVNSVCRSNDRALLASGDDFGKVKLFGWPASQPKVSDRRRPRE